MSLSNAFYLCKEALNNMTTPEEIIARYSTLVMNIARSRVSISDADDVYQEVFYRYIDKEPHFKDEKHEKAWFIRVTCNIINSMYRKSELKQRFDMPDEDMCDIISDKDFAAEAEQKADFENRLARLGAKEKAVLMLYFDCGYNVREIASIYQVTENVIKRLLMKAKRDYRNIGEKEDKHR